MKQRDPLTEESELIDALIRERKKKGLTQMDVANQSGIPQSTVGRIEAKLVSPRLETLLKIMKVIGCTFEDLKWHI